MAKDTPRQETSSTVGTEASRDDSGSEQDPRSDAQLVQEALQLFREDQLLAGLRLVRKVRDEASFQDHKEEIQEFVRRAEITEQLRADLYQPASEGWTKQGESHGSRDFVTYYKVESGGKLKCRIESVIEASLYVPFLATMNETDLYETWFPSWSFPFKLGLKRSKKLKQAGRVEQVVQLTVDLPFPLSRRELIFWAFAEEDCVANRDAGAKLMSVDETFDEEGLVPPPEKGTVRIDFEADFLFQHCPKDHPALAKSKGKYPEGEELILLTVVLFVDPNVAFVPHSFMNFCTRICIGTIWKMILSIAEQVREGKLPAHAELIASKREELYDWVEQRSEIMTGLPPEEAGLKKNTAGASTQEESTA